MTKIKRCNHTPAGKATINEYCKYCYTEHDNWWTTDPRNYNLAPDAKYFVMLCGNCEHTSLMEVER